MKRSFKKLLAGLAVVVMMLAVASISAFAAEPGATEATPSSNLISTTVSGILNQMADTQREVTENFVNAISGGTTTDTAVAENATQTTTNNAATSAVATSAIAETAKDLAGTSREATEAKAPETTVAPTLGPIATTAVTVVDRVAKTTAVMASDVLESIGLPYEETVFGSIFGETADAIVNTELEEPIQWTLGNTLGFVGGTLADTVLATAFGPWDDILSTTGATLGAGTGALLSAPLGTVPGSIIGGIFGDVLGPMKWIDAALLGIPSTIGNTLLGPGKWIGALAGAVTGAISGLPLAGILEGVVRPLLIIPEALASLGLSELINTPLGTLFGPMKWILSLGLAPLDFIPLFITNFLGQTAIYPIIALIGVPAVQVIVWLGTGLITGALTLPFAFITVPIALVLAAPVCIIATFPIMAFFLTVATFLHVITYALPGIREVVWTIVGLIAGVAIGALEGGALGAVVGATLGMIGGFLLAFPGFRIPVALLLGLFWGALAGFAWVLLGGFNGAVIGAIGGLIASLMTSPLANLIATSIETAILGVEHFILGTLLDTLLGALLGLLASPLYYALIRTISNLATDLLSLLAIIVPSLLDTIPGFIGGTLFDALMGLLIGGGLGFLLGSIIDTITGSTVGSTLGAMLMTPIGAALGALNGSVLGNLLGKVINALTGAVAGPFKWVGAWLGSRRKKPEEKMNECDCSKLCTCNVGKEKVRPQVRTCKTHQKDCDILYINSTEKKRENKKATTPDTDVDVAPVVVIAMTSALGLAWVVRKKDYAAEAA